MVVLRPYQETLGIHTESELIDRFINSLAPTNRTHDFFVDWVKVNRNVEALKTEIALLGSLAGSDSPVEDLNNLLQRYPEVSKAIPILIAVRGLEFPVLEGMETDARYTNYDFSKPDPSPSEIDSIVTFCVKTGISSLLTSTQGLKDYLVGVEVGTDTNARKNRSGKAMERLLDGVMNKLSDEQPNLVLHTQTKFSDLERTDGISAPQSLKDRRFDIAVTLDDSHYNIETNFYSGTGSKPQEIVDSYINRHEELNQAGWSFIWITDGYGWSGMTNQVQRAFREIDYVLNVDFVRRGTLSAILSR